MDRSLFRKSLLVFVACINLAVVLFLLLVTVPSLVSMASNIAVFGGFALMMLVLFYIFIFTFVIIHLWKKF